MKSETLKPIPGLATGRDKRLILKNKPDEQLDLLLFKWATDNGLTYSRALGVCLKDWLLAYLGNSPTHKHVIESIVHANHDLLADVCVTAISGLPLARWGFERPTTRSALIYGVKRFLTKQGTLK